MKPIYFFLLTAGTLMLGPAASWADSVCGPNGEPIGGDQCVTFSGGSATLQTTVVPASTTIPVPGFNPALGTLDEVDCLDCSQSSSGGNADTKITFTNIFPEPLINTSGLLRLGVGTPSGAFWISGIDQFFCSSGPLDAGSRLTIDCFDAGIELAGGLPLVSSTVLANFISTGNVFLPLSFDRVDLPLPNLGQTVTFDSVSMNVFVELAYLYTPTQVPEPANDILLITAMLILGPVLWNRKKRFVAR